jgi:hypothetical protein
MAYMEISSTLKMTRRGALLAIGLAPLGAQVSTEGSGASLPPPGPQDYICPMDKDVRSVSIT